MKDKSYFDALFKEYYPKLYYYALYLIRDREASKDIVSEAFEFIWTHHDRIDKTSAASYLYVSVRNKCIDFLRHRKTHREYVKMCSLLTEDSVEMEYREQDERMICIGRAVEKLTPHTRHVFEECYVHRKKYREVAEELDMSVNAVKKQIVKALRTIREECAKKHK